MYGSVLKTEACTSNACASMMRFVDGEPYFTVVESWKPNVTEHDVVSPGECGAPVSAPVTWPVTLFAAMNMRGR